MEHTIYDVLTQKDGSFTRIPLTKLHTHGQFPLLSNINDNGVRVFINGMDGDIVCIDKAGLEDLSTFHKAAFELVYGYYVDEGRHNQIIIVIQHLCDTRFKFKEENRFAHAAISMLMNSMYGKQV